MPKNKSKSPYAMDWKKASEPTALTSGQIVPKSSTPPFNDRVSTTSPLGKSIALEAAITTASKSKPRQYVTHCTHAFQHQAKEYIHGKVDEVEKENVGIESAHKIECGTEASVVLGKQMIQRGRQFQKKNAVQNAHASTKSATIKHTAPHTTRKATKTTPITATKSKGSATTFTSKMWQKKRLKHRMIQAQKIGAVTRKSAVTAGKLGIGATKLVAIKALLIKAKIALATISAKVLIIGLKLVVPILIVMLFVGSCSVFLSSVAGGFVATMGFQTDELSITHATRHYSYFNPAFTRSTDDAFALIAYLTTTHGEFTYPEIIPVLQDIHSQAAEGSLRPTLMSRLDNSALGQFQMLMMTHGGMQFLGSPFDFPWLRHVTSNFGYRIDPIRGGVRIHQGIDIALPTGTPILATHDGVVRFAGEAGGFGLLVELIGENGIITRYAHNSRNLVSSGQTVRAGDVIAHVGSTGDSTGPHLHFELWRDGQVLNPLFFIKTRQSVVFDDIPEPLDEARLTTLFNEVNRHLGKPYVYGANGPDAFDCSSFVAWIYRVSGVYPLPRTTAQGIYNRSVAIPYGMQMRGDIVFFHSTYATSDTITHIGIYAGGGVMVHAGSPVQYTSINTPYWQQHFHGFGRLRWN